MTPVFDPPLAFTRPFLPELARVVQRFQLGWREGRVTKGPLVEAYEQAVARHLGVKHALAVSSGTTGLMLALRALNLEGDCLVPSFTFMATVQALLWNQIRPVFTDCHPRRFTVELSALESSITENTSAVLVPCIFGNPPPLEKLENFCAKRRLALILDAAHGFGTTDHGKPVGSQGTIQVFSTSATKLLCTGEGGMVVTKETGIFQALSSLREYGLGIENEETVAQGLNGRMTEFQGAMGLEGLALLEEHAAQRNRMADWYRAALGDLPLFFQEIEPDCRSSYKDFAVLLTKEWEMSRDETASLLQKAGIPTKKYFSPPLHLQRFFQRRSLPVTASLPNTEIIASRILCLPVGYDVSKEQIEKMADVFRNIYKNRKTESGKKAA